MRFDTSRTNLRYPQPLRHTTKCDYVYVALVKAFARLYIAWIEKLFNQPRGGSHAWREGRDLSRNRIAADTSLRRLEQLTHSYNEITRCTVMNKASHSLLLHPTYFDPFDQQIRRTRYKRRSRMKNTINVLRKSNLEIKHAVGQFHVAIVFAIKYRHFIEKLLSNSLVRSMSLVNEGRSIVDLYYISYKDTCFRLPNDIKVRGWRKANLSSIVFESITNEYIGISKATDLP